MTRCRRFQAQSCGEDKAELGDDSKVADEGAGGINSEEGHEGLGQTRGNGGEEGQEQFELFSKIIQEYIVDGAPNEINLRYCCFKLCMEGGLSPDFPLRSGSLDILVNLL